jgi:hypothetical protein
MKRSFYFLMLAMLCSFTAFAANSPWEDVQPGSFSLKGTVYNAPTTYRTVKINHSEIQSILNSAPDESQVKAQYSPIVLTLPMPNGQMGRFSIVESSIFEPALQAQYPDIRTYLGQGIDDPYATVRLDYTPVGFHAMVLSPFGTVFIDPFSQYETDYYMSYYKHDYKPAIEQPEFICHTEGTHTDNSYVPT